ncbi:MAG TPA: tetraacyldisaccharide 4'-kinase [Candidatus Binataceae bacterium]|nr:tetraacyldisaccharide 4'-kinase [Candidatus Binataceae bacterium]
MARGRPAIERLWHPGLPARWWPLWAALTPAAALYSGALALRTRWWRGHAAHAATAIISVGNLTVGGNAKTPFTLFLAARLQAQGFKVAILSRGWGRSASGARALLVADGGRLLLDPRAAGDEPAMMAHAFAGPIAVARRRADGAALLTAHAPLDAIILDDGFQHLGLRRDLDLLLINPARGFGNGWILPAGPLREPATAIERADAVIVIARAAAPGDALSAADRARLERRPIMRAELRPHTLISADGGRWIESPLSGLAGHRVVAASGLADPAGFHAMLTGLGATIAAALAFPDHYDYAPGDWERIIAAAGGAERPAMIVTTAKDLVKLEAFSPPPVSLYALGLDVTMDACDEARLLALAAERIRRRRGPVGNRPPAFVA